MVDLAACLLALQQTVNELQNEYTDALERSASEALEDEGKSPDTVVDKQRRLVSLPYPLRDR